MVDIILTTGTGQGPTELSAFDSALNSAGISNLNLIHLSSVIPNNSKIIEKKYFTDPKEYGYKAYCVFSRNITSKRGDKVYAGLGWLMKSDTSNGGLFVEHQCSTEEGVRKHITDSLTRMQEYRKEKYTKIQMKIIGIECKDQPVCALVCAIYKTEGWE